MTEIHSESRWVTRIVAIDANNDQLTISTGMPNGGSSPAPMMPMGVGNDLTITVAKPHTYVTGSPMTLSVSA